MKLIAILVVGLTLVESFPHHTQHHTKKTKSFEEDHKFFDLFKRLQKKKSQEPVEIPYCDKCNSLGEESACNSGHKGVITTCRVFARPRYNQCKHVCYHAYTHQNDPGCFSEDLRTFLTCEEFDSEMNCESVCQSGTPSDRCRIDGFETSCGSYQANLDTLDNDCGVICFTKQGKEDDAVCLSEKFGTTCGRYLTEKNEECSITCLNTNDGSQLCMDRFRVQTCTHYITTEFRTLHNCQYCLQDKLIADDQPCEFNGKIYSCDVARSLKSCPSSCKSGDKEDVVCKLYGDGGMSHCGVTQMACDECPVLGATYPEYSDRCVHHGILMTCHHKRHPFTHMCDKVCSGKPDSTPCVGSKATVMSGGKITTAPAKYISCGQYKA